MLTGEIEQVRQTLTDVEETNCGLKVRENNGERYVVLSASALSNPSWTVRGCAGLKLAIEQDTSIANVERQLKRTLRESSAPFETEQRHAEHVEALQQLLEQQTAKCATLPQRIEQLSRHSRCLIVDFRTFAARSFGRRS